MAFTIRKTSEMKATGDLILLYGKPGVGKTYFAASLEKPLVLDVDRGAKSLKDFDNVGYVEICSTNDLKEAIMNLENNTQGFKTIIVDTITSLESMFLYERSLHSKTDTPQMQDYGKIKYFLEGVIVKLKALTNKGVDVVFIAHEQLIQESQPDGSFVFVLHPDLREKSMTHLESQADEIIYMKKKDEKRMLLLHGTSAITAKTRTLGKRSCSAEQYIKTKQEK